MQTEEGDEIRYSSDSEDDLEGDSDNDKELEEKLTRLQNELKEIPFDELLEMKKNLGAKEFKALTSKSSTKLKNTSMDKIPTFKKKNKNMPTEVTSKRQVSRKRDIVQIEKKQFRDPRFDETCGEFNPELFKRSYGFINEIENGEIKKLQEAIKKSKDAEKTLEMKMQLSKMLNKKFTADREEARKKLMKGWKQGESELVKKGKNPYHLKKSAVKKLELVEKYKEFKGDAAKLDKFLEKKRKRNAAKDHTAVPFKRRSAAD